MIAILKKMWFAHKYKRAVRQANDMRHFTGLKYYVIVINGKLKVVPKKTIRNLVSRHRFRKGVTVQDIESRALFVTL